MKTCQEEESGPFFKGGNSLRKEKQRWPERPKCVLRNRDVFDGALSSLML